MLIFGKSVSDWQDKAAYAQDKADNEFAEVREVRCEGIEDVDTAFAAMAAFATNTKCKNFLYHATINLLPGERLSREQWKEAVEKLEQNLKLTGHHRVVFEHIKKDRQHYHIVWLRLPPTGDGPAVNMGNDFLVHQKTAKALEQAFGLKAAKRKQPDEPSRKRREINAKNDEVKTDRDIVTTEVTKIFKESKSTREFISKLREGGYTLTRAKNGSYVIVDRQGGYHGLMRRIKGSKLEDLRAKFPELETMVLPSLAATLRNRQSGRVLHYRIVSRTVTARGVYRVPIIRMPFNNRPKTMTLSGIRGLKRRLTRAKKREKKQRDLFPLTRYTARKWVVEEYKGPNREEIERAAALRYALENHDIALLAYMGIHMLPEHMQPWELVMYGLVPADAFDL